MKGVMVFKISLWEITAPFSAYVYDNLILGMSSLRCSNSFFGRNYIKGMESSRWTDDLGN
jgi:hypothetical protein